MYAPFKAGTLPVWDYPIRKRTSKTSVDSLSGSYRTSTATTLAPGDAVPGHPGMIIFDLDLIETGQSRKWFIDAQGSLDGSPTKIINRGQRRTLDEGWDERTRRVISWHAEPKSITGAASTDIITCTAHGWSANQKVYLQSLTGGAGLTAVSISTPATLYYVISVTTDTFQLSTTSGGSAVNFTTDITAGKILAAEFALGAPHPDFPYMYLAEVNITDDYTDWKTADLTYRGLEYAKPYKRRINGAVTATRSQFDGYTLLSGDIFQNYPPVDSTTNAELSGTDIPVEYDAATLSLTDTFITTSAPPTDYIGLFWTPPDAPDVNILTLAGVATLYYFPFGWKCVAMPAEQIPGTNLWLVSATFVYQVPSMPVTTI